MFRARAAAATLINALNFNNTLQAITIKLTFVYTILTNSERKTPDLNEFLLRYLRTVRFFQES